MITKIILADDEERWRLIVRDFLEQEGYTGMVYCGKKAASPAEGRRMAEEALASGKALDVFRKFVTMQGGDASCIDDYSVFKQPLYQGEVKASAGGYVAGIKADSIGLASQHLGAGRKTKEDAIDLSAGILLLKKVGDTIENGEPAAICFSDSEEKLAAGIAEAGSAYTYSAERPEIPILIKEIIE